MDQNETPQHGGDHEDGFTFLGRYGKYDLWHGPDACGPTIVARWSRAGPDYSSGMCFGWMEDRPGHPLVEARLRAEALGLDVQRKLWAGRMRRHASGIMYTAGDEAEAEKLFGRTADGPTASPTLEDES